MRIAVLCNDTRGGVQPYVALAAGLQETGHDVRAVAPAEFAHLFARRAIAVTSLPGTQDAMAIVAGGIAEKGTLATMRLMYRELPRLLGAWVRTTLDACEGAQILLGGVGGTVIGSAVAERLRVPFMPAHLQPIGYPTSAYPGVLFPGVPSWVGAAGRRVSHHLSDTAVWMPFRRAMTLARNDIMGNLPAAGHRAGAPTLYGFSRHVVPLPEGSDRHVTGYWVLPAEPDWVAPADLQAFIADGKPVISIGFGSMGSADPGMLAGIAVAATRRVGLKVVALGGWNGLKAAAADDVFAIDAVPHDWLFPRMRAVVHHGGAGTTGAALTAGVPSVVVPFAVDQPFWGSRVETLGVGPKPIARRRLTERRLARALEQVIEDATMATRAATLGATLRAEDGVARAVDLISRIRMPAYQ